MATALTPREAWLVALETRDGFAVVDPETNTVLNPQVEDITAEDAQRAVDLALARLHLSEPTTPWTLRCEAAALLGEPVPERPTGQEADRQGLG